GGGGEELQIERVIANLLDNRVKYSPAGASIDLCARVGDDQVTVSVRDRGCGIPDAERQRIFDPFYRSEHRQSSAGGSGLGLAICRGVVEAHRGAIWVEGDEGAVVSFRLPRSTPVPGNEPASLYPAGAMSVRMRNPSGA
ncbi:MAG: sensor histidine kinase, partial [Dehalococcoidia bacterium]